jgi:hypothetical protein
MVIENRLALFDRLSKLTTQEFAKLVFTLKLPTGIMPGSVTPQGDRVSALLNWAESFTSRGLDEVEELIACPAIALLQHASPQRHSGVCWPQNSLSQQLDAQNLHFN